ncbi:lytic transglycosylase domain-containing protein [Actinophytocola sp.]|uniref:lytic transglycosylase domain-containing protein n=1 Tax=Actinophytocola sp. TaxID=1872138 RepID=UPI002ED2317A
MASKSSRAQHRRRGRRANMFAWPTAGQGRHRLRVPSSGLIAMSAVVLAASAASSTVQAAPEPPAPPAEPVPLPASADGGTLPTMRFPDVETHLTSGRFVGADVPATTTGSVPAAVLAAYQRAVERTNMLQPNCHIPLELLAAIGKVESGHARGGRVDETGRTLTPILGPVLNGGPFAAIADTDGGEFDGDTSWDRAVGPMQFIPGTWARWGADGNVDGQLDPQNVYDASLAAARYLCAANRDLGTPQGLDEAILSYNHSTSYLSLVRSWMAVYRNGMVSVEDILGVPETPVDALTQTPPPTTPPPTTPPPPTEPPPTTPPPTTPPLTEPPPTKPPMTPPTEPPPTTPPATPPPATADPGTPPPTTDPTPPPAQDPPAPEQCDPTDTVGDLVNDLVGGLLGEDPNCVLELELATPEAPAPA